MLYMGHTIICFAGLSVADTLRDADFDLNCSYCFFKTNRNRKGNRRSSAWSSTLASHQWCIYGDLDAILWLLTSSTGESLWWLIIITRATYLYYYNATCIIWVFNVAHRQDVLLLISWFILVLAISSKSSHSCLPWVAICKGPGSSSMDRHRVHRTAAWSPTTTLMWRESRDRSRLLQNWRRTGSSQLLLHTFRSDQKEGFSYYSPRCLMNWATPSHQKLHPHRMPAAPVRNSSSARTTSDPPARCHHFPSPLATVSS